MLSKITEDTQNLQKNNLDQGESKFDTAIQPEIQETSHVPLITFSEKITSKAQVDPYNEKETESQQSVEK